MNLRVLLSFIFLLPVFCADAQNTGAEKNLQKHIQFFTDDSLLGRKAGGQGEKKASEYLYRSLSEAGVVMMTGIDGQDFAIKAGGDSIFSRNIVGVIEGYDSKLKNEYIVIGANLDNIGTNSLTINNQKSLQIFPGADANASGLACLIEIAKRVSSTSFLFKRSVIVVGFGAKEMGMVGSWYFVNRAFPHIKDISLMVDMNMLGRSGASNYFAYTSGVSNYDISAAIDSTNYDMPFIKPVLMTGQIVSSDYLAFYERNIPVTLFTTGMHRDYHTTRDVEKYIDYEQMDAICEYIYGFVRRVANLDKKIAVASETSSSIYEGETVYSANEIDKAPEFFRGDQITFLEKWVYDYLKYPSASLAQGVQGKVIVEFIVEKDGSVSNVKVVSGVADDIDAEAVKVVSASPKWKPGVLQGRKVRVKYSIPIEFRLKRR